MNVHTLNGYAQSIYPSVHCIHSNSIAPHWSQQS